MKTRGWLLGAFVQLAIGLALSFFAASGSARFSPAEHVVVLVVGVSLALGGIALGLAPPFLRRETAARPLGIASLAAAFLGDLLLVLGETRWGHAAEGLALLLVAAHAPVALVVGREYDGDPLLRGPQPFLQTDRVAASAFSVGAVGLVVGGVLLMAARRLVPTDGVAATLLLGALPLALGALAFLLPRIARAPLPGATLLFAALAVGALGGAAIVAALVHPVGSDVRYPGAAVALALVLSLVAFLRARLPLGLAARPLLQGASALAALAAIVLVLATLGGAPSNLAPIAIYLLVAMLSLAACAAGLLAGPLLFERETSGLSWARWSAALLIASMFLVAPAFQYDRSAFPGALVAGVALALAALGMAPLLRPAASSGKRRMRRA